MKMKEMRKKIDNHGFTIVELMIALCITSALLAGIFLTFNSQNKSYVVQDQVAMAQQNLRAAMDMLKRDIQMAGFYTNFEKTEFRMDWDDDDMDDLFSREVAPLEDFADTEKILPLVYAGDDINAGTDTIVLVMASQEDIDPATINRLVAGESAMVGSKNIQINDLDIDGDGDTDFDVADRRFGLLVKEDLSAADFFEISAAGPPLNITKPLKESYGTDDMIFRVDIVIYRIDNNAQLVRKNLGSNNGFQVVAENIDNLQFLYQNSDGDWTSDPEDDPAGNFPNEAADVRAIQVSVMARTERDDPEYADNHTYNIGGAAITPNDSFRRKVLTSVVKTRNIGL